MILTSLRFTFIVSLCFYLLVSQAYANPAQGTIKQESSHFNNQEIQFDDFATFIANDKLPQNGHWAFGSAYPKNYPNSYISYTWQHTAVWCWAASIEMILRYHNLPVPQEDIVLHTYGKDMSGRPKITGADDGHITEALNRWFKDTFGTKYRIIGTYAKGIPVLEDLVHELKNNQPVLITFSTGPNTGHAVVVSGLVYSGNTLKSIVIRDPWWSPENISVKGRHELPVDFIRKITGCWYIKVEPVT